MILNGMCFFVCIGSNMDVGGSGARHDSMTGFENFLAACEDVHVEIPIFPFACDVDVKKL